MTSAYIDISTSASRISSQAHSAIDTLRRVKDDWNNLKLIFDQVAFTTIRLLGRERRTGGLQPSATKPT